MYAQLACPPNAHHKRRHAPLRKTKHKGKHLRGWSPARPLQGARARQPTRVRAPCPRTILTKQRACGQVGQRTVGSRQYAQSAHAQRQGRFLPHALGSRGTCCVLACWPGQRLRPAPTSTLHPTPQTTPPTHRPPPRKGQITGPAASAPAQTAASRPAPATLAPTASRLIPLCAAQLALLPAPCQPVRERERKREKERERERERARDREGGRERECVCVGERESE